MSVLSTDLILVQRIVKIACTLTCTLIFLALSHTAVRDYEQVLKRESIKQTRQIKSIPRPSQSLKSSNSLELDSSCLGMFNIGFQYKEMMSSVNSRNLFGEGYITREWKSLLMAKERTTQSEDEYLPLIKSLAKIVTPYKGQLIIQNRTRLQIMEGQLPYVPCPIRNYGDEELKQCMDSRSKTNKPSWIVFMGDSRMRNKFQYFVYRTQDVMKWELYKEKGKTFQLNNSISLFEYPSWINATSPSGNKISFIGAVYGFKHTHPPHPITFLQNLLKLSEKLPEILVINFGAWQYLKLFHMEFGFLVPHSNIISIWNEMIKILEKLSTRMIIICESLTIPRRLKYEKEKDPWKRKFVRMKYNVMYEASHFLNFAMGSFLKNSRVIFWDSTVPFNLASDLECFDLFRFKRNILTEDVKKGGVYFPRFMCNDLIHKSRSTLHDETTMLLNLVCNKFLKHNFNKYCCS